MGLLQFQLREFDVQNQGYTGHVATFSNSLVFLSPAIGLLKLNSILEEFIPGKRVVWRVLDSNLSFVKEKSEWTGTDIVFEISKKDGKTEVRFTHVGLVPRFQCYGDCSGAWGTLINENLRKLITMGRAQSDPFE